MRKIRQLVKTCLLFLVPLLVYAVLRRDEIVKRGNSGEFTAKVDLRSHVHVAALSAGGKSEVLNGSTTSDCRNDTNIGYVLSLSYMDQVASATRRIASLQCWAAQRNMTVVEPYLNQSWFGAPPNGHINNSLKFGDIFDLTKWNAYSKEQCLSPLIPYKEFIQDAPRARNVILVQTVYKPVCWVDKSNAKSCDFGRLRTFWSEFLQPYHFEIFGQICLDFRQDNSLTMDDLHHLIVQGKQPNTSVTLLFDEWRGISQSNTSCLISVKDGKCDALNFHHATLNQLAPSSQLERDSALYISKYLNSTGYAAVMLRWERILVYEITSPRPGAGKNCSRLVTDYLKEVGEEFGIKEVFLATDVGNYGSSFMSSAVMVGNEPVTEHTEQLLRTLSRDSMTMAEYDRRLEEAAGRTDLAYISQLQRVIAAQAQCLLLVGYGTFQQHALALYKQLHGGRRCFKVIRDC